MFKLLQQIPLICVFFIPSRKVEKPEGLYLQRFYLTPLWWLRWFRPFFLHHILLDDARTHHSHPGRFSSLILRGEYTEFVLNPHTGAEHIRRAPAGRLLINGEDHVHYVKIVKPVWSLVKGWQASKVWGFWEKTDSDSYKFIDWRTYLNLPDAKDWPEDKIRS